MVQVLRELLRNGIHGEDFAAAGAEALDPQLFLSMAMKGHAGNNIAVGTSLTLAKVNFNLAHAQVRRNSPVYFNSIRAIAGCNGVQVLSPSTEKSSKPLARRYLGASIRKEERIACRQPWRIVLIIYVDAIPRLKQFRTHLLPLSPLIRTSKKQWIPRRVGYILGTAGSR